MAGDARIILTPQAGGKQDGWTRALAHLRAPRLASATSPIHFSALVRCE